MTPKTNQLEFSTQISSKIPFLLNYFLNGIKSMPNIKGFRISGTLTPSGVQQFSKMQQSVLSEAVNVLFSMCTYCFCYSPPAPLGVLSRTSSLRDQQSVQLEHETSSRNVLDAGNHASKSYFFAAALFNSPETMLTTQQGKPKAQQNSSAFANISSIAYQDQSSSEEVIKNYSTFSNQ
eukprot:EC096842.1.p2 GENE.EC096842.1~~EC096842.1.p2  ORF type:complete len:178 (-),score=13.01 EC096842.1:30-563(-)